MVERITDKLVRDLAPPMTGNIRIYDTEIKGFGVRITRAGAKSFILNYYVNGRERRYTIGSYPEWRVAVARKEAAELKRRIDRGDDPLEERQESRDAPTVIDLFERYAAEHLPRKAARSAADDRSMWVKIILPYFGHRKVAAITHADCDRLHREVSTDRPIRANRVIEVLRKAMNLAVRWGWRADNPASGVQRSPEQGRERYLTPDEYQRLIVALSNHQERSSANAIHLMLLTGCRRGEALAARWTEFNLDDQLWIKPSAHTKQRRLHRSVLSTSATMLLRSWRETSTGEFVFPNTTGKPLTDVKRTWASVCRAASIEGVRLHDLRHTYASILASAGESLLTIGKMLGHTQTQTTARYAHLMDDPLREAAERADRFGGGEVRLTPAK